MYRHDKTDLQALGQGFILLKTCGDIAKRRAPPLTLLTLQLPPLAFHQLRQLSHNLGRHDSRGGLDRHEGTPSWCSGGRSFDGPGMGDEGGDRPRLITAVESDRAVFWISVRKPPHQRGCVVAHTYLCHSHAQDERET